MRYSKFIEETEKLISYDNDCFDKVPSTSICIISLLDYPKLITESLSRELEEFLYNIWPGISRRADAKRIATWLESYGIVWEKETE